MKNRYLKLSFLFFIALLTFNASAQYCAPTVNSSGIYLLQINFLDYGNIDGGLKYITTSNGYTQTLSPSSGTIRRYFGGGFFYSISNPTSVTQSYDFRGYADWNNDNDFTDPGEQCFAVSDNVVPGSTSTGNNITPPLSLPAGNYRIRFVLRQGGTAAPCGSFTGEVEDYIITVPVNSAPVLNTTATTAVNTLLSDATGSNGISIAELIGSSQPDASLIDDNDDLNHTTWYGFAPQGIAITGQAASNGTWQFKTNAGAWTNFGAVSSTNALLLMRDAPYQNYQYRTRIRFVPTGTGTATFTYRAYDGTWGTNGTYATIAATGGSTAFSDDSRNASLTVIPNTGFSEKLILSNLDSTIYTAPFNKPAASIANPELLMTGSPDHSAFDMCIEAATNKLFWIASVNVDKIATSNIDGTGVNSTLLTGLTYVTGIAAGDGKLYYWNWEEDYSAANIYRSNLDGTGAVKISGGAGQFDGTGMMDTRDLEYYNNKIYFQFTSGTDKNIASANADGTGYTLLYTTNNNFGGLTVSSDNNIYWTESDGTLKRTSISGGTATTLLTNASRVPGDVMVDAVTMQVYFIDTDPLNPNYSLIRKVATSGGTASTVITVSGTVTSFAYNPTLTVLAAHGLAFTGAYDASNSKALLQWKTTTEENLQNFILERSTDGLNFSPVGTITALGSATQGQTYPYADDLAGIAAKAVYYRLKQVFNNGRFAYSQTVVLKLNANIITKVSPNPGNGRYNIQLSALPQQPVHVSVYSATGALISRDKFKAQVYKLDISRQAAGVYYAELNYPDGSREKITLIKQ